MSDYSLNEPGLLMYALSDVMFDQMVMGFSSVDNPSIFTDAADAAANMLGLDETPQLDRFTQAVIQSLFLATTKYSRHINLPKQPQ